MIEHSRVIYGAGVSSRNTFFFFSSSTTSAERTRDKKGNRDKRSFCSLSCPLSVLRWLLKMDYQLAQSQTLLQNKLDYSCPACNSNRTIDNNREAGQTFRCCLRRAVLAVFRVCLSGGAVSYGSAATFLFAIVCFLTSFPFLLFCLFFAWSGCTFSEARSVSISPVKFKDEDLELRATFAISKK